MSGGLRKRLADGRSLLMMSALTEMAGSLIRAVVLARILPPEQFGLAVALALVLSLAELAADLGFERSIMRLALDRDVAAQRGTLHALALLRGVALASILLILAYPMAALFGSQVAAPAFALLAICPLLRGLANLGVKEAARDYRFGPDAVSMIAFHATTTIVTVGLALAARSYWAVPVGLIAGCGVHVALTHALSRERWALRWDHEAAREAWRYGAPLAPNGIAQGLKNIGDRLIVGAFLGPATLGLYSIAVMIGVMPRGIALRYVTTVFMPRFVNTGSGPQAASLAAAFAVFIGLLATALGLGLWSLGKPLTLLVFGSAYDPPLALIDAVAIMVAAKMLGAIVTMPAIAFGFTTLVLVGSAGSLTGIALGTATMLVKPDLVLFVYVIALVDGLALWASLAIGGKRLSLESRAAKLAALVPFIILGALAWLSSVLPDLAWPWRLAVAIFAGTSAGGAAISLIRWAGSSPSEMLRILRETPKAARTPPVEVD